MSITTYYVKAKSKKALNEALEAGKVIYADRHTMHSIETVRISALNNGDVIKVYEKVVGGSPYAKAYGNWDAKKQRVK